MTNITLLDGGMGQELVHRAGDRPTPLWSTQVMMDKPGLVAEIHRDYAQAGATVATTNTYAIHRDRLRKAGIADQFADLYALALKEAEAVRGQGRIAGGIGPLGASYRTDLQPAHSEAVQLNAEVVKLLAPEVDLIIFETIASLAQARAALEAGRKSDVPVWLAFTVDDEDGRLLRSGEPLAEAALIAADADAALANCSAPEAMPAALEVLAKSGKPIGAYGNAFKMITKEFLKDNPTVDALSLREDMVPRVYADHVMAWVDQGATIVGGCCETGPAHIAEIAQRLRDAGHTII